MNEKNNVVVLDRLPPAVLQKKAHPARSERYVHINTHDIIRVMQQEGFAVSSVQVTKARHADPLYARHQVDLRHVSLKDQDGVVPRFLFTNSHDGTSSATIMLGAFRYVCSNGLVVGTTYARERVRHSGDAAADLIDKVRRMAETTQPIFDQIERWKAKQLTSGQLRSFARLASVLRWGDPYRFSPDEVLKVRRAEDDDGSLYAAFNRAQENAMRGGLVGLSRSGRRATSRPLSDIINSNDFNGKLWRLAEEFETL